MPKQPLNPETLFPSLPIGFSQVVVSQGSQTIYLPGQTAWDVNKQIVGGNDLGKQTRAPLRNVQLAVRVARHSALDWSNAALPDDLRDVGELLGLTPDTALRLLQDIDAD